MSRCNIKRYNFRSVIREIKDIKPMDYEYRKKIEGEKWVITTEEQAKNKPGYPLDSGSPYML